MSSFDCQFPRGRSRAARMDAFMYTFSFADGGLCEHVCVPVRLAQFVEWMAAASGLAVAGEWEGVIRASAVNVVGAVTAELG